MLTSVIIAKNEEATIAKRLKELSFCDEKIVIDDYSSDKTIEIAKQNAAKVYKRHLNGDFSAQRNFALTRAKGDWVLFVDADESVNSSLRAEIKTAVESKSCDGYYLRRQDSFVGRNLTAGDWGEKKLLRLARKNAGTWRRAVHEGWEVSGKIGTLTAPLLHSPFENLHDFFNKISFYFPIHAISNAQEGKNANFFKIIFMPFAKFVWVFVIKRGLTDGTHGFVYATGMSFHSFLAWSSLWLESRNQKSRTR